MARNPFTSPSQVLVLMAPMTPTKPHSIIVYLLSTLVLSDSIMFIVLVTQALIIPQLGYDAGIEL